MKVLYKLDSRLRGNDYNPQDYATKWNKVPIWVHGDFAIGNILIQDNQLSGVIDFGGTAMGDLACDLVIAWTLFSGQTRDIFMSEMGLDDNT